MIDIRTVTSEQWPEWRDLRLRALADAPEAFSSTLAQWQGAGDTEARWRQRLDSVPFNVVAQWNDHAAGMVSAVRNDEGTELISLWVDPEARGRGVGDALVESVVRWSISTPHRISLCVMPGNEVALRLYGRHGFTETSIECDGRRLLARPTPP